MRFRILAACAALLLAAGTVAAVAREVRSPVTPSPYLIGRRGVETPEADALTSVSFRTFIPTRRSLLVALLAPFHGRDDLASGGANRGIGYEYRERGHLYALSQWPANGGNVNGFPTLHLQDPQCRNVHAFPGTAKARGIVWMTPHAIVMTLQPDGESDARTLQAEWRRLVRRGACR